MRAWPGFNRCPGCDADLSMVEQNHRCMGMVQIENIRLAEENRRLNEELARLRQMLSPPAPQEDNEHE